MSEKAAEGHHHSPRVEDDQLLRGLGRFADDVRQPGQAHAFFVRSPHAAARIKSVDIAAARIKTLLDALQVNIKVFV